MTTATESFANQIGWCERLGSPLTAAILEWARADLAAGGPVAAIAGDWPGNALKDLLALRWAGAMHALVLSGRAPDLARFYPGGGGDREAERQAFEAALAATNRRNVDWIRNFLRSPPQTNEVGRSAVLVGGFLEIARRAGLPLRALEIGASAGLNMSWDRFRYRLGGAAWGDPASKVRLAPDWRGASPPVDAPLAVAGRAACDIAPIDIRSPEARLRLRAYVWPDQTARLAALDGALDFALAAGTRVEKADAGDWVAEALADLRPGEATVLYHSIMWGYVPEAIQARIAASVAEAGRRATRDAPVFWLRFESTAPEARPELRLSAWPGEEETLLARAHPHGASVEWLAP